MREAPLQRGSAYMLIDDDDLITTIQDASRKGFRNLASVIAQNQKHTIRIPMQFIDRESL
ncbi:hypothetical protein [Spirosoma sp.]|uniref:hypothetical protein n=1 Tax=Spirosoma sp. TaxID=1899569 RepID=UPI003B3BDB4B